MFLRLSEDDYKINPELISNLEERARQADIVEESWQNELEEESVFNDEMVGKLSYTFYAPALIDRGHCFPGVHLSIRLSVFPSFCVSDENLTCELNIFL